MIRTLFNNMLVSMQNRYGYDVSYMQHILQSDLRAFLKFMGFQTMSSHVGNLPPEILFAAKIRAIIWGDCGPCVQLVVDMALEARVDPDTVRAIIDRDLARLPEDVAMVVQFTDLVLAHNPEADEFRSRIKDLWGDKGLIAIAYSISSCQVYPAMKYALGHGEACSRIRVDSSLLSPNRRLVPTTGVN